MCMTGLSLPRGLAMDCYLTRAFAHAYERPSSPPCSGPRRLWCAPLSARNSSAPPDLVAVRPLSNDARARYVKPPICLRALALRAWLAISWPKACDWSPSAFSCRRAGAAASPQPGGLSTTRSRWLAWTSVLHAFLRVYVLSLLERILPPLCSENCASRLACEFCFRACRFSSIELTVPYRPPPPLKVRWPLSQYGSTL